MTVATYLMKARQFVAARQATPTSEHDVLPKVITEHEKIVSTDDGHQHQSMAQSSPACPEGEFYQDQRRISQVKLLLARGQWKTAEREADDILGRKDKLYWMNEVQRAASAATGE